MPISGCTKCATIFAVLDLIIWLPFLIWSVLSQSWFYSLLKPPAMPSYYQWQPFSSAGREQCFPLRPHSSNNYFKWEAALEHHHYLILTCILPNSRIYEMSYLKCLTKRVCCYYCSAKLVKKLRNNAAAGIQSHQLTYAQTSGLPLYSQNQPSTPHSLCYNLKFSSMNKNQCHNWWKSKK